MLFACTRPLLVVRPRRHAWRALPLLTAALVTTPAHMSAAAALSTLSRARGALLGALVGDALALGGHYEYDARVIADKVGSYTEFSAPTVNYGVGWGRANYHPGKKAGDGTDAGDVAIFLIEYLAALPEAASYSFDGFAQHWLKQIQDGYGSCNFQSVGREATECPPGTKPGYLNGGTRRTLEALARQPGASGEARKRLAADVNCLVSATHWPALLSMPYTEEESFVRDAVSTTYLSHRNEDPVAAAQFLARAAWRLARGGAPLPEALAGAAAATRSAFVDARLAEAMAKVAEAGDPQSALYKQGRFTDDTAITSLARLWDVGRDEPIKVGKASPTEGALPAALYFALRYADSPERALVANADCGGDSAARGAVIGALLGAAHGEEGLPPRWLATLNSRPRVDALLSQLEARAGGQGGGAAAADRVEL